MKALLNTSNRDPNLTFYPTTVKLRAGAKLSGRQDYHTWHGLVPLGVVRLRGRVGLLLVVVAAAAAAESGRRGGLREPDGRLPELARAGARALERAVPVLLRRLARQVRRLRRREAGGGVAPGLAGVGLLLVPSSHGRWVDR